MAQDKKAPGFTDDEKEAMRARAKELAAEAKSTRNRADGENEVMTAIDAMSQPDQGLAQTINNIVKQVAPELFPKTWYGMPAYANKEGKVICFFQAAQKFNARYATLGFSDTANLDEGSMWPSSFALKEITKADETKIEELIKKATGK